MHYFYEPYLHAIKRWILYDDPEIFMNRIQAMDAIVKTMINDTDPDLIVSIRAEKPEESLLPVDRPTAGEHYQLGRENQAFESARKLVPPPVFQAARLYFQSKLLKALSLCDLPNPSNSQRKTAVAALTTLFRLPPSAGKARLVRTVNDSDVLDDSSMPKLKGDAFTLHHTLVGHMLAATGNTPGRLIRSKDAILGMKRDMKKFNLKHGPKFTEWWTALPLSERQIFIRDVYPQIVQSLDDRWCLVGGTSGHEGVKTYEGRYDRYLALLPEFTVEYLSEGSNLPSVITAWTESDCALTGELSERALNLRQLCGENAYPWKVAEHRRESSF
jgi:hypothetical protein